MESAKSTRGKYQSLLVDILAKTKGKAAVLIVVKGTKGTRATIHEDFSLLGGKYFLNQLPTTLRHIAEVVEREAERNGNGNGDSG